MIFCPQFTISAKRRKSSNDAGFWKPLKFCRTQKEGGPKRLRQPTVYDARAANLQHLKYTLVDPNPKYPECRVHPDPQRIHCTSKNKQVKDETVKNWAPKYWRTFLLRQDRKEKTFFSILNFWFEATVHVYLIHRMRVTEGVSPVNWIKWHARYRPTFTALECESENYQKHNR